MAGKVISQFVCFLGLLSLYLTFINMTSYFSPEYVRDIAPYQAGKPIAEVAREFGLNERDIIKLASNENPLGMAQSARQAVANMLQEGARYPDANGFELKAALSNMLDVPQNWLTLGNGSNDVLELAAHAFLQPGRSAMYSQYAFAVYALASQAVGAKAQVVPATTSLGHDLATMQSMLASSPADLLFIANPNNPTGTFIDGDVLYRFIAAVPKQTVVVLDEAYTEYLRAEQGYNSVAWVKEFANLLVVRTFSKAYGLAGLRLGYGVAQSGLTDLLNRVRQPFNANSMVLAAALAVLQDKSYLQQSATLNREQMGVYEQALSSLGLGFIPSSGNFVLVNVKKLGGGKAVFTALLQRGIIVRPVDNYGLTDYVRISIGLPEENRRCLSALAALVNEQSV